ncbi:cyclic AMP response element-binding protein A [Venturia canescens]|uniref:cyclic AMP response element-binding protein A n=1 Tax=Venturia canescens TaxID=32260 RepID=UPI001C9CBC79|nr:cyclic AMP response element-binding protein A [Venturia canescens]XP_043267288.1 cyclic AMP response element-binding protein A [Venturia canescens]
MEFYDPGSSDLKELWESYLAEPALGQDVLMATREEEWGNVLCLREKGTLGVVLRDRLMTDAALGGTRPIKSEHSYSLLACSPPASPAATESSRHTPHSVSIEGFTGSTCSSGTINPASGMAEHHKSLGLRSRIDDMEEECYPAISMGTASGRPCSSPSPGQSPSGRVGLVTARLHSMPEEDDSNGIKGEPLSVPNSPGESVVSCQLVDDKTSIAVVAPHTLHISRNHLLQQTSDSEDEEEEYYQSMELDEFDVKCEESEASVDGSRQGLPPTPPSSASSDSEGTASASCSPERRESSSGHVQNLRGLLAPRLYVTNGNHTHATRQPIHTSLISCQPKGSTGILTLTDEEKRTLIAEGYPIPTKLPLTKQEEKSLKKVRRKIKNKISAQESRRKKKEYMDGLERRVTTLTNENSSYRDRLSTLEDANRELMLELQRLQCLLESQSS